MNEFNALRARAKAKRDKFIGYARSEYEAALVQIAKLEQDLLGKRSTRYKKISASIESVIPRDAPFTTQDVLTALEALDPGRTWRKRSIDNHFSRLRERGLITRIKRATINEPALYVRDGVKTPVEPLADMTLMQVIRSVLTRPMSATEIVVAVCEAGYKSSMQRMALRNHVVRELGRGGFKQDGGKWAAE